MSGKYKNQGGVGEVYDVTGLGTGLKIKRRRQIDLNHAEALKLLDFQEFAGDRRLRQGHVDALVRAMRRGTFHPEWVQIITCAVNGDVFRMNGQHTAWARLEQPEKWPCPVALIEYEAGSMEDVRILYSSIDRSSPRTKKNVTDSYLVGTEEFHYKGTTLQVLPQGFSFWIWPSKNERQEHDGDDIAYLLKTDHYDLAVKVAVFLDKMSRAPHKHLFRAPVVAAMFATFAKSQKAASEFWEKVAEGTGFQNQNEPGLRLRTELIQAAVSYGTGANSDKKRVSQEYMYRLCIVAWNIYRQGQTRQILRVNERGKRPAVK